MVKDNQQDHAMPFPDRSALCGAAWGRARLPRHGRGLWARLPRGDGFIGEETAGAYYGNNSGTEPTVTLPNSKVRFGLPLSSSWNAVSGYAGKRRGIIPDHVVVTRTADLLRGIDAQLQLALRLAARPRPD
jgi:hypothetical protein